MPVADGVVPHDISGVTPHCSRMQTVTLDFPEALDALIGNRSSSICQSFGLWEPSCKAYLRSAVANGQWPQARLASTRRGWTDSSLCQLCQASVGTLEHRLDCLAIRPTGGWQAPPPFSHRVDGIVSDPARQELLATRGLFALKVRFPKPPCGDTFEWILCPPQDGSEVGATWYVDGSLFDEAKRFARRTGFGIVVVSASGDLIGFGSGIPPHWVVDAAGAELWAMLTVLRLNAFMPDVVTDCKGILDTLYGSPAEACGPKRSLARTWRMVADALDGQFRDAADKLVWMPSHESALSFSSARDSRGLAVTSVMWRANR